MSFAFTFVYFIIQVMILSLKGIVGYWGGVVNRKHDLTGRESIMEYLSHIGGFGFVSFLLYLATDHFVQNDINRPMNMQLIIWLVGFLIWLFLYLPLQSCTVRRLNDSGMDKTLVTDFRKSLFICILFNVVIYVSFRFFLLKQLSMFFDRTVIIGLFKIITTNVLCQKFLSVYYMIFFMILVFRRSSDIPVKTILKNKSVKLLVVIPNIIVMITAAVWGLCN